MRVYLNGQIVTREQARIDPFDRGFIFGDGVYEGLRTFRGRVRALDRHVRRLRESLQAARIGFDADRLGPMTDQLIRANGLTDAFVYWQFTRGTPSPGQPVRARIPDNMEPTVFGYALERPSLECCTEPGITTAARVEDFRWKRGRVKSVSLLGNIMGAMEARDHGADDAIFVLPGRSGSLGDGLVGEATATNVFAVLPGEGGEPRIVTPDLEGVSILAGVTRDLILEREPEIEVRDVPGAELDRATEIMLCGTNTMIASVVRLDGRQVGDGRVGPVARRLARSLVDAIGEELGVQAAVTHP